MILILHIIDKNKATWILDDQGHSFAMEPGRDNILAELDKLKVDWKKISGLVLVVKEASLTQVKIFTAIINTLAWQFDLPVVGEFYYQEKFEQVLQLLQKKLSTQTKFEPLRVEYQHNPDITISQKQPKFIITK